MNASCLRHCEASLFNPPPVDLRDYLTKKRSANQATSSCCCQRLIHMLSECRCGSGVVGCLKITKTSHQNAEIQDPGARLNVTIKTRKSKPASPHQGALAQRPRLSIKARWLNARVSASRRVGSTPASQHQGALAQRPRLSIKARWLNTASQQQGARTLVVTTPIMAPSTAHVAGKLALIVEHF